MYRIPILPSQVRNITDAYVKELKKAIKSDGCTGVSQAFQDCCVVHDLGYRFDIDPWGEQIERFSVDYVFRDCMRNASFWGRLFSRWRFPVVRILGVFFDKKEVPEFETYIYLEPTGDQE